MPGKNVVISISGTSISPQHGNYNDSGLSKTDYLLWKEHEDLSAIEFPVYRAKIEESLLRNKNVIGVVLFTRNFVNIEQLKTLISEIKYIAASSGKTNFAVMIDHEGGFVQRFTDGFTRLPPAQKLGEEYDLSPERGLAMAFHYGFIMAAELKACGIDISLAPVCDLDAGNAAISRYKRSMHSKAETVVALVHSYMRGMKAAGMHATLKHFPGHGQDIGDSHISMPVDNRTIKELSNDLMVFQKLLPFAAAVMPAHIIYPAIDPRNTAGMSEIWLKYILRMGCSYKGVIISDCLSMAGAQGATMTDKINLALMHGDIALVCNESPWEVAASIESAREQSNRHISERRFIDWVVGPDECSQMIELSQMMFKKSWNLQVKEPVVLRVKDDVENAAYNSLTL